MDFFKVVENRRSVRKFLQRGVEEEKIDQILSAALRAPSSRGKRSWEFVVVDQPDLLDQLSTAKPEGGAFLKNAALAIVVCLDPAKAGPWIEDGAIAAVMMQLSAQALGLGSCWVHFRDKTYQGGRSSRERIAEILGLPSRLEVECAIALGYPDQASSPYPAGSLPREKVSHNAYGKPYS